MKDATKWDSKVLLAAGGGLVLLSGAFLWHDLQVRPELLVALAAVVTAVLTMTRVPKTQPLFGPIALLATGVIGGFWYAATKEPLLLAALGVTFLASLVAVRRSLRVAATPTDRLHRALTWFGAAIAGLAASWAFYFQFLTLTYASEDIGRRMVLTLAWLLAGAGLVVGGKKRGENAMRDAGFFLGAFAVAKALLYDTTHLYGGMRVAVLGVAGLLLLGTGWLTSRVQAERS